jgi:hypothetical protein
MKKETTKKPKPFIGTPYLYSLTDKVLVRLALADEIGEIVGRKQSTMELSSYLIKFDEDNSPLWFRENDIIGSLS